MQEHGAVFYKEKSDSFSPIELSATYTKPTKGKFIVHHGLSEDPDEMPSSLQWACSTFDNSGSFDTPSYRYEANINIYEHYSETDKIKNNPKLYNEHINKVRKNFPLKDQ